MKMRCLVVLSVVCISALIAIGQSHKRRATPSPSPVQIGEFDSLDVKWQKGQSIGVLGSAAQVHVPVGYVFAGGDDTRIIVEANHNPTSGKELGYLSLH